MSTKVTREHKPGLVKVLGVVGARSLIRKNGMIDGRILQRDLHSWIVQAEEAPVTTSSDQYRAELYDEMFEKARSLGFGNIIGALTELEALKKADVCTDSQSADFQSFVNLETGAAPEQVPVKYEFQDRDGNWHPFMDERHYQATVKDGTWPIRALYTHADPSEVEQLRADIARLEGGRDLLLGDLERRDATVDSLRDQLESATQRADAAEQMLRELLDCPWVVEEATIPKAGIEAAPNQVVGTMHVALVRLRKARALLSASAEPTKCKCSLRTRAVGDGCSICNPELATEYANEAAEDDQHDLITNLVEIIDEELMPHAHKLPIQDLQRLNETLMAARKALK